MISDTNQHLIIAAIVVLGVLVVFNAYRLWRQGQGHGQ